MDQVKVAGDRVRFCVDRLKEREIEQAVQTKVKNKFQALCDLAKDEENKVDTLEDLWEGAKTAWIETCEEELGIAKREDKPWISNDTLTQINARKLKKEHLNKARTRHHKQVAQKNYLAVHKVVRASIKRDKRHYYDELAREGEEAAAKGNLRQLYENTRRLTNKWRCSSGPIKDSTGKLLTSKTDQGARWAEYFKLLLNQPPPAEKCISHLPTPTWTFRVNCRQRRRSSANSIKVLRPRVTQLMSSPSANNWRQMTHACSLKISVFILKAIQATTNNTNNPE